MSETAAEYKSKVRTDKNTVIITAKGLGINSSKIDSFFILTDPIVNPSTDPIEEGPPFDIQLYAWEKEENKSHYISDFWEMKDFAEVISSLFTAIRDGDELWDVRDFLSHR